MAELRFLIILTQNIKSAQRITQIPFSQTPSLLLGFISKIDALGAKRIKDAAVQIFAVLAPNSIN
jgi:hypothetical protein